MLFGSNFLHEVVIAQLHRQGFIGTAPTSFASRFFATVGLGDIFFGSVISTSTVLVIALYGLFALGLGLVFGLRWRNRTRNEWLLVVVCLSTAIGVLTMHAPNYTSHYADVPAAALAPLLGFLVAKVVHLVNQSLRGESLGSLPTSVFAGGLALVVLVASVAVFVPKVQDVTKAEYASSFRVVSDLKDTIAPDLCVVSDFPNDLIAAGRYLSTTPDCPPLTDPFGMYLVNDDGNQPHPGSAEHPIPQAFAAAWLATVQHTEVVVQSVEFSSYFPWDDLSRSWFASHFTLIKRFQYPTPSGMLFQRLVYLRNDLATY